jgi:gamma-glutamylcyclotransferase (GGCT)/AIG2-like uncharacterized protein YtfP
MRRMFLNGTAMSGQADHAAISGARFLGAARTAPCYRFLAVRDEFPGLLAAAGDGQSIVGELYEMTDELLLGSLLPGEPPELELGEVTLAGGEVVSAMRLVPERIAAGDPVADITGFGGWVAYRAHLSAAGDRPAPPVS